MRTKTTKRFENAVSKLYKAFHKGTLRYGSCSRCAVGNIVGSDKWADVFCGIGSLKEIKSMSLDNYVGEPKEHIDRTGYSPTELATVEYTFYVGQGFEENQRMLETKETQFNGLCAVVEYLAKLDSIPNPMDYKSLFETENDKPKRQLIEVFQCN